jgi:membrane-bound lytic murein transglycosylase
LDTIGFYPFIDAGLTNALHFQSRILSKSPKKTYRVGNLKFSNRDINYVINTLQTFQFSFPVGLSSYFDFYQIKGSDGRGNVKFSAYYTPVIEASKIRSETYFYPVYKKPDDWEGKFPTRQEIENEGALEGLDLCLGYVKSRKDLYSIQLEGSAILKFKDGATMFLAYDGDNNREEGEVVHIKKEVSLPAKKIDAKPEKSKAADLEKGAKKIDAEPEIIVETEEDEDSLDIEIGIAENALDAEAKERGIPKEEVEKEYSSKKEDIEETEEDIDSADNEEVAITEIDEQALSQNPNYVFFKKVNLRLQSSSGQPLTPYTSIATDRRYIPSGAVLLAAAPVVDKNEKCRHHALQFVLAQDTGGAIKGAGHVDWYVGQGDRAEKVANRIHHYGQLWLVLPKKKRSSKLTNVKIKGSVMSR